MKCVIPGVGIKAFGKAIFCLSKIGEELYIEALDEGLALKTVNTARSAFACFLFERKFFHLYRDGLSGRGTGRGDEGEEEEPFKCKISTRSLLSVFKSLHTLERTVDRCSLNLDLKENKLVFVFHCRHGVVKTHCLGYQECEALQAVFSKDLCPNHVSVPAKVLSEVVTHFPTGLEEVTLIAHPASVKLRNYVEDEGDGNRPSLTEISLLPEEFDHYQVGVDCDITFCLKELKAILMFTDAINHSLSLRFEEPGRPVVLSIEDGKAYKADFVLATLLDSNSAHHNSTSAQNQTRLSSAQNGNSIQYSQDNSMDTTAIEQRPRKTSTTSTLATNCSKPHPSIKPQSAASSDFDFPSGSQFNQPSTSRVSSSSVRGASTQVPPPPDDFDFMDIEYADAEIEQQAGHTENQSLRRNETRQQNQSSINRAESRHQESKAHQTHTKACSSANKSVRGEHNVGASGSGTHLRITDDFDVMDAIFGDENLTDVAEEGNQFGFGVEKKTGTKKGPSPRLSLRSKGHIAAAEEMEEYSQPTQDSIINDSGFLPRSPPAKKLKADSHSALFGMTMFSSDHNKSEVLAPDSDEEVS